MVLVRGLILIGLLGVLCLFLENHETRAIFFPSSVGSKDPTELQLEFENVVFQTSDHKQLHGWFLPVKVPQGTLLFCHGNAGNISFSLNKLAFFNRLGLNVFIFDYRGYGKSEGRPSERGLYKDGAAAYDYLLARGIRPGQIIGYGESLGGAVICDVALHRPMRALILDSTFTSLAELRKVYYKKVSYPILFNRFETKSKIAQISIPKLIIHSENDEMVPFFMGQRLFEIALLPKEFLKVHGSHNQGFFNSESQIRTKITDFLMAHLQ